MKNKNSNVYLSFSNEQWKKGKKKNANVCFVFFFLFLFLTRLFRSKPRKKTTYTPQNNNHTKTQRKITRTDTHKYTPCERYFTLVDSISDCTNCEFLRFAGCVRLLLHSRWRMKWRALWNIKERRQWRWKQRQWQRQQRAQFDSSKSSKPTKSIQYTHILTQTHTHPWQR